MSYFTYAYNAKFKFEKFIKLLCTGQRPMKCYKNFPKPGSGATIFKIERKT